MEKAFEIIDIHCHIYPAKIEEKAVEAIGKFYNSPMKERGTAEALLEAGKTAGTGRFVVHSVATTAHQVQSVDDFIAYECSKHGEFIGFGSLHPDFPDIKAEVERMKVMGLKGIKFHPDFQEFNIDDEKAMRMYEQIPKDMPILFHMGDERRTFSKPVRLSRVMDVFKEHTFIAAHFGGYMDWDEADEYLVGRKNLYMDTSSALFKLGYDRAERMIHTHGEENFLYGTDFPMWNPKEELGKFMQIKLKDEERRLILGQNAKRLLGL